MYIRAWFIQIESTHITLSSLPLSIRRSAAAHDRVIFNTRPSIKICSQSVESPQVYERAKYSGTSSREVSTRVPLSTVSFQSPEPCDTMRFRCRILK
jgi:hypothetical protein